MDHIAETPEEIVEERETLRRKTAQSVLTLRYLLKGRANKNSQVRQLAFVDEAPAKATPANLYRDALKALRFSRSPVVPSQAFREAEERYSMCSWWDLQLDKRDEAKYLALDLFRAWKFLKKQEMRHGQ